MTDLPVAVIGAGPQGLAAAAHLTERGVEVVVVERGTGPAAAVSEWGHVRLFSAWPELTDASARRLLAPTGWQPPLSGYPTGAEWVSRYLAPLADALAEQITFATTVTSVTRQGRDRTVDSGRNDQPFILHTLDRAGHEGRIAARAVIDASGTWSLPNPAGADGTPARGERDAATLISYRIPAEVSTHAGQHLVVIGAGHSASHAVLRLSELARTAPGTRVTWLLRRGTTGNVFGGGVNDELPERAALGSRAREVIESGLVDVRTGFRVAEFRQHGDGLTIASEDGHEVTGVSRAFTLTGFRPDLSALSEIRTSLDPSLEAVAGIAAEIDPNVHSCGSIGATGARELAQPEENFFIVGAKSYGRAPTFLALTGFEQVRSVTARLAGDFAAADRDELVLPDTGVCGGSGDFDGGTGTCCTTPTLQIGRAPAAIG